MLGMWLATLLLSCTGTSSDGPEGPTVTAVDIVPTDPTSADDLGVVINTDAEDVQVTWSRDGDELGTGMGLDADLFAKGDLITASVVAVDGDVTSEPVEATVTILNTAPAAPVVTLSPDPAQTGAPLWCEPIATDIDDDDLTYTFEWAIDDEPYDGDLDTTVHAGDTLPGTATASGDWFECTATADDGDDTGSPGSAEVVSDELCDGIEAITRPIYVSFVMHNEEDDVGGVPGSNPIEPDYNGDETVFAHFANAVREFGQALEDEGAVMSFQSDWGFLHGVERFRPDYFGDLVANPAVEMAPHAHETYVPYEEVYDWLDRLGAEPEPYLGGLEFERYEVMQEWFEQRPEFVVWESVTVDGGENHTKDLPAPTMLHRAPWPDDVSEVPDVYVHDADGILVTPGIASVAPELNTPDPATWFLHKPPGHFITVVYLRYGLRGMLAHPDDTSVPEVWRASTSDLAYYGVVDRAKAIIDATRPWVGTGDIVYLHVSEMIDLYLKYEPCLDLEDGMDLTPYVPDR